MYVPASYSRFLLGTKMVAWRRSRKPMTRNLVRGLASAAWHTFQRVTDYARRVLEGKFVCARELATRSLDRTIGCSAERVGGRGSNDPERFAFNVCRQWWSRFVEEHRYHRGRKEKKSSHVLLVLGALNSSCECESEETYDSEGTLVTEPVEENGIEKRGARKRLDW